MSNDNQDQLPKPVPQPIAVIQCDEGYIEFFENNMIGVGTGKAPVPAKET